MMNRRKVLSHAAVAACGSLLFSQATAKTDWPQHPVSFLVGFPPGGNIDFLARLVANELGARLGQPVTVDNRTGAGGNIATQAMVRAPADGHTLGFAAITMATNPALMKSIGYDPLQDVMMVAQMSSVPVIVTVGAHTPYKSLAELVAGARAKPGGVTFGHGGHGTSGFLASTLFGREAGIEFLPVPYRGTAPIFQALLGGQIDGTFAVADANLPGLLAEGKIRALAVLQETRLATLPNVPTARESGYGASTDFRSWHGIMVRSGTPATVVARLHAEVNAVIGLPGVQQAMAKAGLEPRLSASPAAFQNYYRSELTRWSDLVRVTGITPE